MARKTTVMLQDDLDGSTATQTLRFGFQGVESKRTPKDGHASKADPKLVREWAAAQGIEISSRGRIPSDIQDRYIIFVGG